jgi:hypothetical protein
LRRLIFILTAYLALAALYAVFTPKWQAPDEPAHFNASEIARNDARAAASGIAGD